jgi:hypothetical protein
MEEVKFESTTYRLRAGAPMPVIGTGEFVLHTFKAEISKVDTISCTEVLPASSDFRGQGGYLMSASFNRLGAKGGKYFSGRKVYPPDYVEEEMIYK